MAPGENIALRRMTEEDLEEVLQIEQLSFPSPWSRAVFLKELSLPIAKAIVAQAMPSNRVVGYLCLWLVAQEGHILNLAVHPDWRREGIGTRLLGRGVDDCRERGAREMSLEVRRSNYKAISLYQNFHFMPQGIRRRYYTDSGEDAVIMGLCLTSEERVTSI